MNFNLYTIDMDMDMENLSIRNTRILAILAKFANFDQILRKQFIGRGHQKDYRKFKKLVCNPF